MRSAFAASSFFLACTLMTAGCTQDLTPPERSFVPLVTTQTTPAVVPAFLCAVVFDGQWRVPAGSEVVVNQRWEARTRGLVQDFLNAQTTTLALNGGSPSDVTDQWGSIIPVPTKGVYRTSISLPTGVTLAAGETMTFDLVLAMSHRVLDGIELADEDSHKPFFFGPGTAFDFGCTVTAK